MPCVASIKNIDKCIQARQVVEIRRINKQSLDKIKSDLCELNWHKLLQPVTTDHAFDLFQMKLENILESHAPLKRAVVKPKKVHLPWITGGIQNSIRKQKLLYKKSLSSNDANDVSKYKNYRTCLNRIKQCSKVTYYRAECVNNMNNSKKLWHVINKILGKQSNKTNVIDHLTIDGVKTFDSKQINKELAEHFSSIGKKLAENIGNSKKNRNVYLDLIKRSISLLYFYPTNEHDIELLIRKLPYKTSSGHDNVNNNLLKDLKIHIVTLLAIIFNKSMSEGIFPSAMKKADVIPLHKGQSHDNKNNYRPISLLLTLSKFLEKIIYKHTYNFLDNNGLLFKSQYSFRSNHSCEHAIGELVGNIAKNHENAEHMIAIYLDLSKAFDTISHKMLLKKLDLYGICGTAHDWFEHYLLNRQMRVKC